MMKIYLTNHDEIISKDHNKLIIIMKNIKLLLIILVFTLTTIAVFSDFRSYTILLLNENILFIENYRSQYPLRVELIFFSFYIILISLSLPLAFILGLLSGIIFDTTTAIFLVSFASAIGATFAFLLSRYLFRDYLKDKYHNQYLKINNGIEKNSNYYIFALRMCVVFPFFIVNLLLGLTTIRTINYYIISQIGMLPGTIIIIFLGKKIAGSLTSDISIDLNLVLLLAAFGLLPLVSRIIFKRFID
jgi:uncharacterized membrane protein YdjX (TVP38/TMEM64 family)